MKLTIPFGTAENLPRMSDESFEILLNASRKRLAAKPVDESDGAPKPDVQTETKPSGTSADDDEFLFYRAKCD